MQVPCIPELTIGDGAKGPREAAAGAGQVRQRVESAQVHTGDPVGRQQSARHQKREAGQRKKNRTVGEA